MNRRIVLGVMILTALMAGKARANNVTWDAAYSILPGGQAAEGWIEPSTVSERWYRYNQWAGRSYCAETQGGVDFDAFSNGANDTVLTLYGDDHATVITSNDDAAQEPRGGLLSRACYVAAVSSTAYIKVRAFNTEEQLYFRLKLQETTLFSNWFFVGSDYGAYTLLRNTTAVPLNYTIKWRNAGGIVIATHSGVLPGNGSTFVNGRDFAAVLAAGSGTVEVVHDSSPDAIVASTTVLSPTTGLSFDAPFQRRRGW